MKTGRSWRQLARYVTARVVGLAALGGLTALGVGTFGTGPASGVKKAHVATPPVATSVDFAANLQIQLPAHYATAVQLKGDVDFTHHALDASISLPSSGLQPSKLAQGLLQQFGPLQIGAQWVGDHAFLTVPAKLAALLGGGHAFSYPVSSATAQKLDTVISQSAVAITYPDELLDTMDAPAAQHPAGRRTIGGVPVTGTKVTLTVAQLLKVVPGLSALMGNDLKSMAGVTIPVTMWVDAKGRLVKATMAASAKGSVASITGTLQFSHYNRTLDIAAPAAGSVKALSTSQQQLFSAEDPFESAGLS
jgi:hypothetical protein